MHRRQHLFHVEAEIKFISLTPFYPIPVNRPSEVPGNEFTHLRRVTSSPEHFWSVHLKKNECVVSFYFCHVFF